MGHRLITALIVLMPLVLPRICDPSQDHLRPIGFQLAHNAGGGSSDPALAAGTGKTLFLAAARHIRLWRM